MVSVIIPTYRRANLIENAILSVAQQSFLDIEIVVVDDNGRGTECQLETENIVNKIRQKISSKITYIIHEINKGACAARNTGIRASKGDYVGFLDDDDIWAKDFIKELVVKFEDQSVGLVYANYFSMYKGRLYQINKPQYRGQVYEKLISNWGIGSTSLVLLKKSCVLEVDGFDENLPNFEEYDLWIRLSKICDFDFSERVLVIKQEGHGFQLSSDPSTRESAIIMLEEKMKSQMSDRDYQIFMTRIPKWKREVEYNYLRKNYGGCGFFKKGSLNALKRYFRLERKWEKRFAAITAIVFGNDVAEDIRYFVLCATNKMRKVSENEKRSI